MRIDRISFTHFRCFGVDGTPSTFEFGPGINVILGENASGKTALLDGIVAGLGAFYEQLDGIDAGTALTGYKEDATRVFQETPGLAHAEPRYPVKVSCTGTLDGKPVEWARVLRDRKGRTLDARPRGLASGVANLASRARSTPTKSAPTTLPVLAHYGHGRLSGMREQALSAASDHPNERLAGYVRALGSAPDQRAGLPWWQRVELAAAQRSGDAGPLPEHAILTEALRRALPGAERVWYDGIAGQPMVRFSDRITPLAQLSAGYRTMLGIVLDLVYRVTRLNPDLGLEAARETPGIVLIDEIDQHLHPQWQRQVLGDLRATFPKVQFILTTHAPQVLAGARNGEVRILRRDDDGRIFAEQIDVPPGLRADEVLTGEWFGLPSTLDPETLALIERHRQMLRSAVAADDAARLALEAELRRRLGRFNDTSLEGMALSVLADLTADRPARTAQERAALKAKLKAQLQERLSEGRV